MKTMNLKSWAFPHVLQIVHELAGLIAKTEPDLILQYAGVLAWEVLDTIPRDPKHLHKLTPRIRDVLRALPRGSWHYVVLALPLLIVSTLGALMLQKIVLGPVGYTWLSTRETMSRLIYGLACTIQGWGKRRTLQRQRLSSQFLRNLHRFGLDNPDPELQAEIEQYESQLGHLFLVTMVGVMRKYPHFTPEEITAAGLIKYGVPTLGGLNVCYFDGGAPCTCGSRWQGMHAPLVEQGKEAVFVFDALEMDGHMTVYGVGRNSAISALTGPVRALSEFGGELTFRGLIHDLGGIGESEHELGVLYRRGRYDADFRRSMTSSADKRQALIKEIADVVVSWPCLVTQAFGLDYVRCLKRSLIIMAEKVGVNIVFP